jgi:hypothetical protein
MKITSDHIEFNDHLTIGLKRTLRIPDDDKTYPLPPGMGNFPIYKVGDYLETVPEEWLEVMTPAEMKTAVFIPMYQREAMWVSFNGTYWCPTAISMAIGKVNVITGEIWDGKTLSDQPQNYMVAPRQPWIDGIKSSENTIKQFVAMPLGQGYTVEGQVTGEEKYGGIQLVVFEPKVIPKDPSWDYNGRSGGAMQDSWWNSPFGKGYGHWDGIMSCSGSAWSYGDPAMGQFGTLGSPYTKRNRIMYASQSVRAHGTLYYHGMSLCDGASSAFNFDGDMIDVKCVDDGAKTLGLAAGGNMKQRLYPDDNGIDFWNQSQPSRIYIHICNSVMFEKITGKPAPPSPIDAKAYAHRGYPWFDLYDEKLGDLTAQEALKAVKSINEMDQVTDSGFDVLQKNVITYAEKDAVWTPK